MSYKAGSKSFSVRVPTHTRQIRVYDGWSGGNSAPSYHTESFLVADRSYVDVNINLYVDDNPFNAAAKDCRNSVKELTGSVTAMKAAQVQVIKESGTQISSTIINGFYNMVKSELSQQLAEMYSKFEAKLARVKQISKMAAAQKETMERDYSRISRQYLELFNGLDEALNRRIHGLDAPAFNTNEASKKVLAQRFVKSGIAGTLISANENPAYQIQLEISSLRKRIQDTIEAISAVLNQEKIYEEYIKTIAHEEAINQKNFTYIPVMCYKADELNSQGIYTKTNIPTNFSQELNSQISQQVLKTFEREKAQLSNEEREKIDFYFQSETDHWMSDSEGENRNRNNRVAEMINHLWKQDVANNKIGE
ncbi:MAG: hypothetical protein IKS96_05765 [Fibrobacter sp.]|nr:hypothetical protein [Fibrobacter sp.]